MTPRRYLPTISPLASILALAWLACGSSQPRSGAERTVEQGQNTADSDSSRSGARAAVGSGSSSSDGASQSRTRRASVNVRIAMGVQTSSPISDHAQVVIDDGAGGAFIGHLVRRDTDRPKNTRPGDRRLVMEGAEGAYLSHYDPNYQRIARVILEDIHHVDAIAIDPNTGDLLIAGQEHFYPKSVLRTKLRILGYRRNGSKKSAQIGDRLRKRLPRRALGHRIEDMIVDQRGDIYVAVTVVRRRKKRERTGRGDVTEMALARLGPDGKAVKWYSPLTSKFSQNGGEYAGKSEIAALALSPDGTLIAVGHSGGDIDPKTPNRGSLDIFVHAVAPDSGELSWTRTFGTEKRDVARDLAIAADGTLVVVGNSSGQLFANPNGDDDAFIMALDKAGNPRWSEQLGTGQTDRFHAVVVTGTGAIVTIGETDGQLALERPASTSDDPQMDVLIAGYSPAGVRSWMFQAGTAVNDYPADIAASSQGGAHVLFDTPGSLQGAGPAQSGPPNQTAHKDMVLLRIRD